MHQQTATRFSDLGIKTSLPSLVGEKIKIEKILNREIIVHSYRIEQSKYPDKGNGKCLYIQIHLGDSDRVVFTGSVVLQETIEKIPKDKFPFVTTIVKENDRLIFT